MRSLAVIILVLVVILVTGSVFAQTQSRITVGGTYWNAAYSWTDKDGNDLADIGTGNMFGPYLRFTHGKFNFGTSLFFGSFPVEGLKAYEGADVDFTMGRTDLNFTLGYQIIPYINLFAGVKYINYSYDGNISYEYTYWTGEYYDTETLDVKMEVSEGGPMYGLGIAGVIPFGQSPLYGFASLAAMAGTLTNETKASVTGGQSYTNELDVDAALAAITLGIGYHAPSGLGLSLGYRADLFTEDVAETEDEPRIYVQGLNLTLSYTF